MKVCQIYESIDLNKLEEQAVDDEYAAKKYQFVSQVWDMDLQRLTKKQVEWLEKIADE